MGAKKESKAETKEAKELLRSVYHAYKKFPKDKLMSIKPADFIAVMKEAGVPNMVEKDVTISLLMVRAAHETSESEFVESMSAGELPTIKLSKNELSCLAGGGVASWAAGKASTWLPKLIGGSNKAQFIKYNGANLISSKLGDAVTVGQGVMGVQSAAAAGGAIGGSVALSAAMAAVTVGGAVGLGMDKLFGTHAGVSKQGSMSNFFWTDVGKKIGYID